MEALLDAISYMGRFRLMAKQGGVNFVKNKFEHNERKAERLLSLVTDEECFIVHVIQVYITLSSTLHV